MAQAVGNGKGNRAHHAEAQGKELLDLCITIGAYNMVSRVLVALQIGH